MEASLGERVGEVDILVISCGTDGCVFSAAHHRKGTMASWCKSVLVSSYTARGQVEFGSLCCAASIFLALLAC